MIKSSRFRAFIRKHKKSAPVIFFILGFTWDSLTLGSVDRLYDQIIICVYLLSLSVSLYLFNLADDEAWKETFLERFEDYFPLAIQFFIGGLCSAYVIFFFRSVSFTKTVSFFIILVVLLFANELLKKRISNKYLQFGTYFFVNLTFFTFFVPVVVNTMNTVIFIISGGISLSSTLFLVTFIYNKSPSTRKELDRTKLINLILVIYASINIFYFFNLIPPVPLAMEEGIVAHNVEKQNGSYEVTYQESGFLSAFDKETYYKPGDSLFIFTSIFAPADLKKKVNHHWQWMNPRTEDWETSDKIEFEITGGRDGGYRGYTYKTNMLEGKWKVDVKTSNDLILGRINFTVIFDSTNIDEKYKTEIF
ncbi:MAG: DUF2914 domain-containing protein [Balneola sp.]